MPQAMKTNPGGNVDPKDVIGRDALIERIWDRLEVQSLSLTAERRVGKTSILKKMQAGPRDGWVAVYQTLEAIGTTNEFVLSVFQCVEDLMGRRGKFIIKARNFFEGLGGASVGGLLTLPPIDKQQWKSLFKQIIMELVEQQSPHRVIFLWDELPWMLQKIGEKEGVASAMEVLDLLRALRQTHPHFRAVFTGSIGLHHVLTDLKRQGYANEPINDMGPQIEVPPLAPNHAADLTQRLLIGAGFTAIEQAALVDSIVEKTGGVAYYIHILVDELCHQSPRAATAGDVSETVRRQLTRADDPWSMRHYADRIPEYYDANAKLVIDLLDGLAVRTEAATTDELRQDLSLLGPPPTRDELRELLRLLVLDHYLEKTDDSRYRFRFALVRRWWLLERELTVAP